MDSQTEKVFKNLRLQVVFNTVRKEDGSFVKGTVAFNTDKAENLVKECMEKEVPMPRVYCSRDGAGCPTMINELQAHNYHAPMFNTQLELIEYTQRIIVSVSKECEALGGKLKLMETDTPEYDLKTPDFTIATTDATPQFEDPTNLSIEQVVSMFESLKKEDPDLSCEHCGKDEVVLDPEGTKSLTGLKYYKYLGEQVLCDECAENLQQEADIQNEIAMEEQALEEMQMEDDKAKLNEELHKISDLLKEAEDNEKETDNDDDLPF